MTPSIVTALAAVGVLALACQLLAWRFRAPAILFLLLAGILAGPVTGLINPDQLFGQLLFPLVSMLVAVILFEGSLTLRLEDIEGLQSVVRRMVSIGLVITWVITAVATHGLLGLNWPLSILFGAIMVVTGPTVVAPMLRSIRPNAAVANILRWEGIVIDPIGAILAVIVYEIIVAGEAQPAIAHTLLSFSAMMATGLIIGALAGWALGLLLRNQWIPGYLHNLTGMALLFAAYALSNEIREESGLLTVTVMGIWLANMRGVDVDEILDFNESLSLLFVSGLFILLAARLSWTDVQDLGWPALGLLAVMLLVARPIKVLVCTWGSTLTWQERALLAWVAPRGIVAAAVSALFALRLNQHGIPDALLLVPLSFVVIIGTVLIHGGTARHLALRLGVTAPEPHGVLVVGANMVARMIAKALHNQKVRVILADPNREFIKAARMEGLPTFFGNPVSARADSELDLTGIGRLLALSPSTEINGLAALRYRSEFGKENTFILKEEPEPLRTRPKVKTTQSERFGQALFGESVTFELLADFMLRGASTHSTKLSEAFDFAAFKAQSGDRAIPLFALDAKRQLRIPAAGRPLNPAPGWTLISLILPDATPLPLPTQAAQPPP